MSESPEQELLLTQQRVRDLVQRLAARERDLAAIHRSLSWSLLQALRRLRYCLAPADTRRDRVVGWGARFLRLWRDAGLGEVCRRIWRRMRGGLPGHSGYVDPKLINALVSWQRLSHEEPRRLKEGDKAFVYRPLISFITPVFNPPADVLREAIASVRAQTYDHWELCLVDGNSSDPEVRAVLEESARQDTRVRVRFLDCNRGIAGNSNVALEMAQGEFLALLDHDDLIEPRLLHEVVRRLNDRPQTDLVYFDESIISADASTHFTALLKPDWSPELLLSTNYLMHSVIRHALVRDVGGFDPSLDGAQDWDLILRCTERTQRIEHIARILYHWRQIASSCAASEHAKPYVLEAQTRALESHLKRIGTASPKAFAPLPGILRCVWPTRGHKVSIVIPTKDKLPVLRRCVKSILRLTKYPDYEILLIDNDSTEKSTRAYYESLRAHTNIRVIDYRVPFNYSAANNLGARHATGDFLLFLNNDTEVLQADWLEELARWAERPGVGAVGTKLLYPNGTIQHAGVIVGLMCHAAHVFAKLERDHQGLFGSVNWYRNYLAVTGACVMIARDIFEKIGGFDEAYELVFSDVEICLRLVEHGYRIVYTPFAALNHYEGLSRANRIPPADFHRASRHMVDIVESGDPYFNPNLSYNCEVPLPRSPHEESRLDRLQRIAQLFESEPAATSRSAA